MKDWKIPSSLTAVQAGVFFLLSSVCLPSSLSGPLSPVFFRLPSLSSLRLPSSVSRLPSPV
ncbi:MAG TPA: hypothetical protein VK957_18635 [Lunatimonas sp.]|nr:hypothetical protein [Lunatimonas sp.]